MLLRGLMNPTPPIINTLLNLLIWCRIPAPSLMTPSPHSTIKLSWIKILKTGFRKLSIFSKFWKRNIWQGLGVILLASLWHNAYENRNVTCPLSVNERNYIMMFLKYFFNLALKWVFPFSFNILEKKKSDILGINSACVISHRIIWRNTQTI